MSNQTICNRCVMDETASDIKFTDTGCNYCDEFIQNVNIKKKENDLINLLKKIKKNQKGKYDCVVGLSGGVDSSYVLIKCKEFGLNPLAVHMDNGWNTEIAQNNIENLVKILGYDLYTHVIDWYEYKSLMQSFFDADVIDVELLYDNAMLAVNYNLAKKYKLKYILAGTNTSTEGMKMPKNMNWFKYDKKNIKSIVKKFGNYKISTFPLIGTLDLVRFKLINRIKWISILDFVNYNKNNAEQLLKEKYKFKTYKYKHYESVFTRFYQGYILPKKFNIDKRKLHLSTLIITNQIERNNALNELKKNPLSFDDGFNNDKNYFLKKMDWEPKDLNDYLKRPEIKHDFYPTEKLLWDILLKIYKFFNK